MKSIGQLTHEDIKDIKLIAFDVDGVTIKKGTDIEEEEKKNQTTLIVKTFRLDSTVLSKMVELKKHFKVCIISGRSLLYLTEVYYDLLWENAALVGENGIFILSDGEVTQMEKFDSKHLDLMRGMFFGFKGTFDER